MILFMAYCDFGFRPGKRRLAAYQSENNKLELWLTGLTSLSAAALLAPGLIVWFKFVTVPEGTDEVEVLAQQWSWSYRFPEKDGKLGTADNRLISYDNPLGITSGDPNGQDDVVIKADDQHLALGRQVKMLLRAAQPIDGAVADAAAMGLKIFVSDPAALPSIHARLEDSRKTAGGRRGRRATSFPVSKYGYIPLFPVR